MDAQEHARKILGSVSQEVTNAGGTSVGWWAGMIYAGMQSGELPSQSRIEAMYAGLCGGVAAMDRATEALDRPDLYRAGENNTLIRLLPRTAADMERVLERRGDEAHRHLRAAMDRLEALAQSQCPLCLAWHDDAQGCTACEPPPVAAEVEQVEHAHQRAAEAVMLGGEAA